MVYSNGVNIAARLGDLAKAASSSRRLFSMVARPQRSSGYVVKPPADSTTIEVVAWNTGDPRQPLMTTRAGLTIDDRSDST
jgi:hypothetical protein